MTPLEILGKLDKCTLFDREKFEVRKISKIFAHTTAEVAFYREIQNLALKHGRRDIFREIDCCFRRSRRISRWLSVSQSLSRLPLLWRAGGLIKRRVLRGSLM